MKSPRNDRRATALAPRTPGHVRLARAGPTVPGDPTRPQRQRERRVADEEVVLVPQVANRSQLTARTRREATLGGVDEEGPRRGPDAPEERGVADRVTGKFCMCPKCVL